MNGEGLRKMINKTDNYARYTFYPQGRKSRYNGNPVFPGGKATGAWR